MSTSVKYRAHNFKPGDLVTLYTGGNSASPYVGVVTHVFPKIDRVGVEWPTGNQQEDPKLLQKTYSGLHVPAVSEDTSYSSYQNDKSEKQYGKISSKIFNKYAATMKEIHIEASKINEPWGEIYNIIYNKYSSISDETIKFVLSNVFGNK